MNWETDEIATFARAVRQWGRAAQWLMVWEETAELGVAVAQMLRGREVTTEQIAEEIADVLIMMGQATHMVGIESVRTAYTRKLSRLQSRLDKSERDGGEG